MSPSSAIRCSLNKNKGKFEDLFETVNSEDDVTDDEESEDESANENDSDVE